MDKTETVKWISAVKEGLDATNVTQVYITDRKTFRRKVFDWKVGEPIQRD